MTAFSEVMRTARSGLFDTIATEKLNEVVKSVRDTGKKGKLTVTLTIEQNGDNGMKIDCRIKEDIPSNSLGDALMFDDIDGNLHRKDPQDMFSGPIGTVEEPRRMIRDEDKAANS